MPKLRGQDGSALLASLVSVAALLILFLAVFSSSAARYSLYVKSQYAQRAHYLAESGLNHTLHQVGSGVQTLTNLSPTPVMTQIDGYGSYSVSTRPFGAYLLLTSLGKIGSQTCVARAVVGRKPDSVLKNAIVLTDERFPLTVTGTTQIEGDILTGPIEITPGQIDGQGIYQEKFHNGSHIIGSPASQVTSSANSIADYIQFIKTSVAPLGVQVSTSLVLEKNERQYLDEHKTIHLAGNLDINGMTYSSYDSLVTLIVDGWVIIRGNSRLEGLIEIISDKFILLQDNSSFDGGVCFSEDSLVISDDCHFAGQGIVHGQISVRDRARITYPSALIAAIKGKSEDNQAAITLSSRRRMASICLLIPGDTTSAQLREKIYADTGTSFEGVIYSSGYTDLRGNVTGTIITPDFWYYQAPTTYINWLRNAKIERDGLRFVPAMPLPFGKNNNLKPLSISFR